MRLNIFLVFLFVVVGASAAVRPVSMSTTNGQAVGTTTIGGRLLATNTVANGGSNQFSGSLNASLLRGTNVWNSSNVKFYGAVGDGVTDDTTAFNSALTNGGDIFIPDGTYKINRLLVWKSNTRLHGSSKSVLTSTNLYILFVGASPNGLAGGGGTMSNVTFSGFSIVGANTDPTVVAQSGIVLDGQTTNSNVVLENLSIQDCSNDGVLVINSARVSVLRMISCRVSHCGQGVSFSRVEDVIVNDCSFENIQHPTDPSHGVYLSNCRHVTVSDCAIRNMTNVNASAIACSETFAATFTGNVVTNTKTLITVDASTDVAISGNVGDGEWSANGAIRIAGSTTNISILGNALGSISNNTYGIFVYSPTRDIDGVSIIGNRLRGFTGPSIAVSSVDHVAVEDNVIDPGLFCLTQYGIFVLAGRDHIINNNQVTAGASGIYLESITNSLVSGNHIFTKYAGLSASGIREVTCINTVVQNNKVDNGIAGSWTARYDLDTAALTNFTGIVDGNTGIGQISPNAKLDVTGDIKASTTMYSTGNLASISGVIHGNASGVSNAVDVIAGNCIVITTNADRRTFTIAVGNPTTNYIFFYTNTATASSAYTPYKIRASGSIQSTNTATANTALTLNGAATGSGAIIEYKTNNTSMFFLNTSGNLGIGTATPGVPLDVNGTARFQTTIFVNDAYLPEVRLQKAGVSRWGMFSDLDATGTLSLYGYTATAGTKLVVQQSGNVGIGLIAPTNKLQVIGAIQSTTTVFSDLVSPTNGILWQGGAQLTNIYTATATLDFGNAATIGCSDLTMTVTGAALGDVVDLGVPNASVVANSSYSAWVSAADTVTVRFCALISGDPASGVFRAEVHKWK